MVVAIGRTLVEPLPDVEVNVPGVIAMLAAPVEDQLSVALVPEFMFVGLAENEVMVGMSSFALDEVEDPQPASPAQASRTRTSTLFFRWWV